MDSLLSMCFLLIPLLICITAYTFKEGTGNYLYFGLSLLYAAIITREKVLLQISSTFGRLCMLVGILVLLYYGVFQSYLFWKNGSNKKI